jgi:hypothetical protein
MICCAYTGGCFESQHYINIVRDLGRVCLAADRKVWTAALNLYIKRFRVSPILLGTVYSGASVHELYPFLEAVREPKCS